MSPFVPWVDVAFWAAPPLKLDSRAVSSWVEPLLVPLSWPGEVPFALLVPPLTVLPSPQGRLYPMVDGCDCHGVDEPCGLSGSSSRIPDPLSVGWISAPSKPMGCISSPPTADARPCEVSRFPGVVPWCIAPSLGYVPTFEAARPPIVTPVPASFSSGGGDGSLPLLDPELVTVFSRVSVVSDGPVITYSYVPEPLPESANVSVCVPEPVKKYLWPPSESLLW